MNILLDDSTSTDATSALYIQYGGNWKLLAGIPSGDAASIAFEERPTLTADWVPMADRAGLQLALTVDAPSANVRLAAGQYIRCTRSGGTEAVTVTATPID